MSGVSLRLECPTCERLAPPAGFRVDGARLLLTCGRCGAEHLALVGPPPRAGAGPGSARPPPGAAHPPALHGATSAPAAVLQPAVLQPAVRQPGVEPHGPPERAPAASPPVAVPALRVVPPPDDAPDATEDARLFTAPEGHCPKCVAPRPAEALACAACGLVFVNAPPRQPLPPAPLASAWRQLQGRWEERAAHDALLAQAQAAGQLAAVGRLYRLRLARQPDDAEARRALEEVVRLALLPSERPAERHEAAVGMEWAPRRVRVLLSLVLLFSLVGLVLGLGARLLSAWGPPLP